jgi:hypothetical protein
MMNRLFPALAFAGPFRGSGIGVCRTFLGTTIGVCRTFLRKGLPVDGLVKPRTGTRFSAYKAFVFTKRLFSKAGSGLRPACLRFVRCDEGADCRSSPHGPCDSKEKEGRSRGDWWDGGRMVRRAAGKHRRLVAGRSPPMAVGSRRLARGARPSTRLGKAAESATLRGAERRGLRRDRRVSDSLAFVPHDRRGYHPPVAASYRRPATPCPHYTGPAA